VNFLIDIGHPAHVHLYRNLYRELSAAGHRVSVTVRDIPSARGLLDAYGIPYSILGSKADKIFGKALKEIGFSLRMTGFILSRKIRIAIGSSATIAIACRFTPARSVIFDDDDDEVQPFFTRVAHPLAFVLISPEALKGKRRRSGTIYYPGFHELAYLHPRRFTPDPSVLRELGIRTGEPFFVMRFNVFKAHHDLGETGLKKEQKVQLIKLLKEFGKVFITEERDIDPEFSSHRITVPPDRIHSMLYFATLFVGDSQTMTSESAILGTPSLRFNTFVGRISYLEELEYKYGLTFGFTPERFEDMIKKIGELLSQKDLKKVWKEKRNRMLADKIDLTAFMVWFAETFPESIAYTQRGIDYRKFK
jgi:predicted glycosyltransferase